MANTNWKQTALALGTAGAVVGILAALRWGNQYLDQFENLGQDELARGQFFTTAEGWRLHHTVAGEGAPVVMIHGFLDSLETWRRNMDALTANHRVYALDVLGFGSSDRVRDHVYTLRVQARVLDEFFRALGIEKAAV